MVIHRDEKFIEGDVKIKNPHYSESFQVNKNKSDIKLEFIHPIILDENRNYKVSLNYFSVYNTIKNVTNDNFTMNIHDKRTNIRDIERYSLRPGSYEIVDINSELQRLTGITSDKIKFEAIPHLNRVGLRIMDDNYQVRFYSNEIADLLGFKQDKWYGKGFHIAENAPKIEPFHTINIKCNLVRSGYVNDQMRNILYSFPAFSVPIGYKIIEYSQNKYPLTKKYIDFIEIKIVNEKDELIDFGGETISLELHIEEV